MAITIGQRVEPSTWYTTNGTLARIPDPSGRFVNLQFSRWAGCPICNMHLASYRNRSKELHHAGVQVVIVFHSPLEDTIDLRSDLPFALVADPDKRYYRQYGVRRSPFFLFNRKAFARFRHEASQGRRAQRVHGGIFGLPADFLVDPSGRLTAVHYGKHADDNMSVDDILALVASDSNRARALRTSESTT